MSHLRKLISWNAPSECIFIKKPFFFSLVPLRLPLAFLHCVFHEATIIIMKRFVVFFFNASNHFRQNAANQNTLNAWWLWTNMTALLLNNVLILEKVAGDLQHICTQRPLYNLMRWIFLNTYMAGVILQYLQAAYFVGADASVRWKVYFLREYILIVDIMSDTRVPVSMWYQLWVWKPNWKQKCIGLVGKNNQLCWINWFCL